MGYTLDKKYGVDDTRTKYYYFSKWPNFMIDAEKPIIDLIHDDETICTNIDAHIFCEYTQAIVLIKKLPSSGKDNL